MLITTELLILTSLQHLENHEACFFVIGID